MGLRALEQFSRDPHELLRPQHLVVALRRAESIFKEEGNRERLEETQKLLKELR